jgi:hypothetical protein
MITGLIISFLVYKLFGKNILIKKETVKASVCEDTLKTGGI